MYIGWKYPFMPARPIYLSVSFDFRARSCPYVQAEPDEGPRRGETGEGEYILPSGCKSTGSAIQVDLQ